MRLKSRGLGRKELVMDFREYNVVTKGKEIVIEGTITEPVHWDFTIRMCQDDLPGITKVLLKKDTILFLLKAALTRNKEDHWSSKHDDDVEDSKPAAKPAAKAASKPAAPAASSAPSGGASDRAAKLAEAKARAAQAKADSSAPAAKPSATAPAVSVATTATPAASGAESAPAAAPRTTERPKFDAAQPKLPRSKVKADKVAEPLPAPKAKRTGAPLASDDYSRGLKKQVDTGTAPSASSFATGSTVKFGAPPVKPSASTASPEKPKSEPKKPSGKADAKSSASKKQTAGSSDSKDKTSTDNKSAVNGGKKPVEAAEGTKS